MATPSKKGVQEEPHQRRDPHPAPHHLVVMRLLAEVEVRRDDVLREVHQQVADEHRHGGAARFQRLGEHPHADGGQHEAAPEGDQHPLRLRAAWARGGDQEPPGEIRPRRGEGVQQSSVQRPVVEKEGLFRQPRIDHAPAPLSTTGKQRASHRATEGTARTAGGFLRAS
jgi:hypothetical protein